MTKEESKLKEVILNFIVGQNKNLTNSRCTVIYAGQSCQSRKYISFQVSGSFPGEAGATT